MGAAVNDHLVDKHKSFLVFRTVVPENLTAAEAAKREKFPIPEGNYRSSQGNYGSVEKSGGKWYDIPVKTNHGKDAYHMKQTLGMMIAQLRKQKGMTQLELAEKMGVTDKAVSKWERDLSCPDINSLPTLAETLGVSVEELMQIKKKAETPKASVSEIVETVLKGIALAMGVAVTVLTILDAVDAKSGMILLGLGLTCAGISLMNGKK